MRVYLDNSATTALDNDALKAMMPYFSDKFGNPSSLHQFGREALQAVDESRAKIASLIGAKPNEIYFTSGGSESDNWALKGTVYASKAKNKHIVTTAIEHPAILETCEYLEKKDGVKVSYVPSGKDGRVTLDAVKAAVTDDTLLVSVMFANNETGAIQPIKEIGEFCHEQGILFHTDAVQAMDSQAIDVNELHIDMLSMSAHKFHGPKGIGALYCRKGIRLPNLIEGGAQESGRRAGTESVYAMVGMAAALKEASDHMAENAAHMTKLRDRLIDGLLKIDSSRLNGDREHRLPGNVNVSFEGVEGESLLLYLDMKGVSASSGSACTSGSLDPSHVLLAIGLPHEVAHGSLRLSLCESNTEEEIDYIISCVPEIIDRLRSMSPLWERIQKERGNA